MKRKHIQETQGHQWVTQVQPEALPGIMGHDHSQKYKRDKQGGGKITKGRWLHSNEMESRLPSEKNIKGDA